MSVTPATLTVSAGTARSTSPRTTAVRAQAAGVSFEIGGEMLPLVGLAQITLLGAALAGHTNA